ncbi:bifunctional folylpolyglutamate synthase/dihydrofolate synthase [Pullulanibacillus camelliae]|uniref:Dihydrofolate synthase/folylpolyglutamate synthase n=1 Tax=Pullulanibacillus camelliae TaxID=1707096 RepID=A0A8J3DUC2_9BACL|nr:folylpolyglutamate synthase/dihydrofolate synthase family protein [Pullulanibacillus camelliae]GGE42641.1 bifunctional folylpolyglutamate synthase/dihydrofolate synthase [Pullulanibacillus camelliae]
MFSDVSEVKKWLEQWLTFGIKLGLERMEWMLEQLDHPEHRMRTVHIGGTNGKGSTLSYLSHILREAGYEVGAFTSPALYQFNDRITKDGLPISDTELIEAAQQVKPVAEGLEATDLGAPTEFEVITMIALVYFAKINPCDIVLFEVGLGGRHDSTNVIKPLLTILTNVGHDHMKQLGPTLEAIAFEKAGIIKPGVPLITAADGNAFEVFKEIAEENHAKVYQLGQAFKIQATEESQTFTEIFDIKTPFHAYPALKLNMIGQHQIKNAALAVMAADYLQVFYSFYIEEAAIRRGLEKMRWPGRFERLSDKPLILVDGAHNLEGMQALVRTMEQHFPEKKITTLFATLKDKDNAGLLRELSKISDRLILTGFKFERALNPQNVLPLVPKAIKAQVVSRWQEALEQLVEEMNGQDELLLITGSLYFVSQVRVYYKQNQSLEKR